MNVKYSFKCIFFIFLLKKVFGSVGDNSPFYHKCIRNCKSKVCDGRKHDIFDYNYFGLGLSLWSCSENCEYECQWKTVDSFIEKNWAIPQFKGKWPFIRVFGLQEPASVFFSVINFFVVLQLFKLFRREVSQYVQYYYVWNIFSLIQLNSWLWSSVYHTRDTDFTEKMDYMSAFLVIIYSLYAVGLRYIGTSLNIKTLLWSMFCGSLALHHLTYLWVYKFDYSYNMKLNCILGGITVVGWLLWSFLHFSTHFFVWKVFLFSLIVITTTLLELLDFPPILWIFDAHALWHCSNILVNYIFFIYIIDDCKNLMNTQLKHKIFRVKEK